MVCWAVSGTSPEDEKQERAEHEAAHFISARVLGLDFHMHWITIETRATSGGSNGIGFYVQPSIHQAAQFYLAGLMAQILGRVKREQIIRAEADMPREDLSWLLPTFQAAMGKAMAQGHDDITKLTQHPEFAKLNYKDALLDTYSLVETNWDDISIVARELVRETTMFGNEARIALDVTKEEALYLGLCLSLYRKKRRPALAPPLEWFEGQNELCRAGTYAESYPEWFQRDPLPDQCTAEEFKIWWERRNVEEICRRP